MHLGRGLRRSQSVVGPETAEGKPLIRDRGSEWCSVSLTNPRSKRHSGYQALLCLEKKLNGQVQPESACVQLVVRNLFPSPSHRAHVSVPIGFFLARFLPFLCAASSYRERILRGKPTVALHFRPLPTNQSRRTRILTREPFVFSFVETSLPRVLLFHLTRVIRFDSTRLDSTEIFVDRRVLSGCVPTTGRDDRIRAF